MQTNVTSLAATGFTVVLCFLAMSLTSDSASASPLEGICFDGGECSGVVGFKGNSFDLCEESCELSNPVSVAGMDAALFDAVCTSDHSDALRFRLFITKFPRPAVDGSVGLMIMDNTTYPLVSCSEQGKDGMQSPEVQELIQRFFEYADLCRGGPVDMGDVEKQIEMQEQRCEDWARIEIDLNQNYGFCYGIEGQATAEFSWHKCGLQSIYRPFEPYD